MWQFPSIKELLAVLAIMVIVGVMLFPAAELVLKTTRETQIREVQEQKDVNTKKEKLEVKYTISLLNDDSEVVKTYEITGWEFIEMPNHAGLEIRDKVDSKFVWKGSYNVERRE